MILLQQKKPSYHDCTVNPDPQCSPQSPSEASSDSAQMASGNIKTLAPRSY